MLGAARKTGPPWGSATDYCGSRRVSRMSPILSATCSRLCKRRSRERLLKPIHVRVRALYDRHTDDLGHFVAMDLFNGFAQFRKVRAAALDHQETLLVALNAALPAIVRLNFLDHV